MKKIILSLTAIVVAFTVNSQQLTTQEKLGYPRDAKLVIIHADDLGVAHSENVASIDAFNKGIVKSGSIMVPCPWFKEIANYAVKNPNEDLGLHLTLTSEWNNYKWSPVASKSEVPSLVDQAGFFYSSVEEVVKNATAEDVEKELRSQIEQALAFGIDITHFDSHMGTLFSKKEFAEIYVKLGKEYQVPILINGVMLSQFFGIDTSGLISPDDFQFDFIVASNPGDFDTDMAAYYAKALKELNPGLTYLIIHTAYNDDEMKAVSVDHPYWGAEWRQQDYDFFTSVETKKLIEKENIQVITMREIRDKIIRK